MRLLLLFPIQSKEKLQEQKDLWEALNAKCESKVYYVDISFVILWNIMILEFSIQKIVDMLLL